MRDVYLAAYASHTERWKVCSAFLANQTAQAMIEAAEAEYSVQITGIDSFDRLTAMQTNADLSSLQD